MLGHHVDVLELTLDGIAVQYRARAAQSVGGLNHFLGFLYPEGGRQPQLDPLLRGQWRFGGRALSDRSVGFPKERFRGVPDGLRLSDDSLRGGLIPQQPGCPPRHLAFGQFHGGAQAGFGYAQGNG